MDKPENNMFFIAVMKDRKEIYYDAGTLCETKEGSKIEMRRCLGIDIRFVRIAKVRLEEVPDARESAAD